MLSPFAHNNGIRYFLIYCFNSQEKDSVNNDTNVNSYKKIFLTSETGNEIISSYDYFLTARKLSLLIRAKVR